MIPDWLVALANLVLGVAVLAMLVLLQLPRERGERIVRAIVRLLLGKNSKGGN